MSVAKCPEDANTQAPSRLDFALKTPTDFGFPFAPYDIQQELMTHLYEAIEQRKVAILESPTGTGKSLSIICSSLSWIRNNRQRVTEAATAALLEDLKKSHHDEPEWVLEKEIESKRQELLAHDEELENRLKEIRAREAAAKARVTARKTDEDKRPAKRQRLSPQPESSDEEFAPDSGPHGRSATGANGSNGLSASVQALLDKYGGSAPKHRVLVEDEPDSQKIFFTSRTHSQLSQFVGEIRKTGFADGLRGVALGSRVNLCINDKVRKASAGSLEALNEACTELQKADKSQRCPYLPPLDEPDLMNDFRDHTLSSVMDVEELASLGRQMECCPYYGSRRAVRQAQLVTLPYNLLMQKSARDALGLSLKDHVVIVDEAHNIIDTVLGIHTIVITSIALSKCRQALATYVDKFKTRLKGSNAYNLKQLLRVFDKLVAFCDGWLEEASKTGSAKEHMKTVNDILSSTAILDQINMRELDAYLSESKIVRKVAGYAERSSADSGKPGKKSQSRSAFLSAFYRIQSFLLSLANSDEDGRVLLSFEAGDARAPTVTLKYQLLNPSEHFKDVVLEARSVVLAEGTMAPISDFRQQLFSYLPQDKLSIFSCHHIVPKEHIFARSVGLGPAGRRLELRFESRGDEQMLDDYGAALFNISNIVTKGVVCFFPSYALLDGLAARWRASGLWTRRAQAYERCRHRPEGLLGRSGK